ncbi:hypothetical protein D3C86_1877460 [compost metagenome]
MVKDELFRMSISNSLFFLLITDVTIATGSPCPPFSRSISARSPFRLSSACFVTFNSVVKLAMVACSSASSGGV